MAVDLNKLLATIEAASRVYEVAKSLVEDAAILLGKNDQDALRVRMMELREQNEEGFERLQAKLAQLMQEGGINGQ
jgi:hypothetical protein